MKKVKFILSLMAFIAILSALNAQQKYALLIGGDYKPGTEIPINHKWNNGLNMDPDKGYDEFWNDTYLIWELLWNHKYGYSNDNIEVLFAEGIDYTFPLQDNHYSALQTYGFNITDGAATRTNVLFALDELANAAPEDYVFIWIMSNGGNTDPAENVWSYVYLWGYDPGNPNAGRLYDYELKAKLDQIPAHKKVVVVQAPNSGKFATTLADDNTIVYTSSGAEEPASRANDTPFDENEEWGGETYYHGEFGYHFFSPLNGEDPAGNSNYGPFSFDEYANSDDVISFEEAYQWLDTQHNGVENPVVWVPPLPYTPLQHSWIVTLQSHFQPSFSKIFIQAQMILISAL
jgi:hypothetical protein